MTTKNISASELFKAIETAGIDNVVHYSMKKEKPTDPNAKQKKVQTTSYLLTKYKMNPTSEPTYAWLYTRNIEILKGPVDPVENQNTFNSGTEGKEKLCRITISGNHSGDYGKVIKLMNDNRERQLLDLTAKKIIPSKITDKVPTWWPMYSEKYSEEHTKDDKLKGQPYPDPKDNTKTDFRIGLNIDFKTIGDSVKNTESRGRPVTIIKDFRTGKLNKETGIIEYALATVDGKPIDETNVHKFLTKGSIIEEMYIAIDTSRSMFGISSKQTIREMVVNPKEYVSQGIVRQSNIDLLAKLEALQLNSTSEAPNNLTENNNSENNKNNSAIDNAINSM